MYDAPRGGDGRFHSSGGNRASCQYGLWSLSSGDRVVSGGGVVDELHGSNSPLDGSLDLRGDGVTIPPIWVDVGSDVYLVPVPDNEATLDGPRTGVFVNELKEDRRLKLSVELVDEEPLLARVPVEPESPISQIEWVNVSKGSNASCLARSGRPPVASDLQIRVEFEQIS